MRSVPACRLAHALLEQYFNTHCRENGIALPPPRPPSASALPERLRQRVRDTGLGPFAVALQGGERQLVGIVTRPSLIGWHCLDERLWLEESGEWTLLEDARALADLMADHLAASQPYISPHAAQHLKAAMRNSIDHAHRYHERSTPPPSCEFVHGEQGLRQGHSFHVTSKASEGFDDTDLQRFAPELGARFRLHYFAVAPSLYAGSSLWPADPEARQQAVRLLHHHPAAQWPLLACHPWQANRLLAQPAMAAMLARGDLLSLGPLGEVAIPTSSVRTVWLPQAGCFLKLALDIRITNFVRHNPPEQVRRALDASQALAQLPAHAIDAPHFRVLLETGVQSLAVDDPSLLAGTAVLHRQALDAAAMSRFQVMAAVLEASDDLAGTGLAALLREAAGAALQRGFVRAWWQQYLGVTLQPLLDLFFDHGIGLEAHLQNSLVRFDGGWPACGLVRDMEGATVSEERASSRLPADSPARYPDAQGWQRFQYYVLVNHIGQVAAVLARGGVIEEAELWREVGQCLAAREDRRAAQLCRQATLPAKANLLSTFAGCGEHPLWVSIPNPLYQEA